MSQTIAMSEYPEKTCEIDRLIRHPALVAAAVGGRKTQQRRNGVYAYPGESFQLEDVRFTVTGLDRQRLADMTEQDAQAEGFADLASYREMILRMHGNADWNAEAMVWVHSFRIVPAE